MYEILQSETYANWFASLRDANAKARINARLRRVSQGNLGDHRTVREGVCELRLDSGPGYRIYYLRNGPVIVVLLAGGDKDSQYKDIEVAVRAARDWRRQ